MGHTFRRFGVDSAIINTNGMYEDILKFCCEFLTSFVVFSKKFSQKTSVVQGKVQVWFIGKPSFGRVVGIDVLIGYIQNVQEFFMSVHVLVVKLGKLDQVFKEYLVGNMKRKKIVRNSKEELHDLLIITINGAFTFEIVYSLQRSFLNSLVF